MEVQEAARPLVRVLLIATPAEGVSEADFRASLLVDVAERGATGGRVVASASNLANDASGANEALAMFVLSIFPLAGEDKAANIGAVAAVAKVLGSLLAYPIVHGDEVGREIVENVLDQVRSTAYSAADKVDEILQLRDFAPTGKRN